MNLFILHGILQSIAFIVLFPLGALVAYFRENIVAIWFPIHVSLQMMGLLVVLIALYVMYVAKKTTSLPKKEQAAEKQEEKQAEKQAEKEEGKVSTSRELHRFIGPLVVFALFIQFFWAFYGRKIVEWTTWYRIHMMLATIVILGGFTNIFFGIFIVSSG